MLHLNPGSMFGRTFTAEEIASLLSTGMIAQAVPERFALESPVEIGEAETPPPVLITALTDLYSRTPEVEAAFLAQVGGQAAGTIQKHLLIALEMKSRVERVIHATATVVREVDEVQNYLIDVVVFDLTSDLSWAQAIRAHLKPFYQSRWGSRILLTNPGQPS